MRRIRIWRKQFTTLYGYGMIVPMSPSTSYEAASADLRQAMLELEEVARQGGVLPNAMGGNPFA